MASSRDDSARVGRAAFVHREVLLLGVLSAIAIAAFFLTRAVAANNRDMSLRDAAEWYAQGNRALVQGRVENAIDAFRRAMARDRENKTYALSLARALASHQDNAAARSLLLTLRDATPEDAEINLELARLAAREGDVDGARRFYHSALYAPWPIDLTDARRAVRFEFIRFLLMHHDPAHALPELLAATPELPDEAAAHVTTAQLFAEAGDQNHALEQFQRALQLARDDAKALAGAGQAAYQLGQFTQARDYLNRAPRTPDVAATLALIDEVLADDPLAPRIGSRERARRLMANLEYARQRLEGCFTGSPSSAQRPPENASLDDEATDFATNTFKSGTAAIDQDSLETGVDLLDRISSYIATHCAPMTPRDQAQLLISRRHTGGAR
jgi:Tfp pilus assembly protein PilF